MRVQEAGAQEASRRIDMSLSPGSAKSPGSDALSSRSSRPENADLAAAEVNEHLA
eukprot:CAMPEP_0184313208 /NCGR_PEP_ID=MMETSP1049-20130417/60399_1 /TAXON_ID=77928 /ORGANISM="Proteomonas sulcata, Strain CCMP704" /LENGTH=54 /DNA_ID=CAMNT_0026630187 /DNA_START=103 /DNA_END=267 /DNA_ORIENTATION=-